MLPDSRCCAATVLLCLFLPLCSSWLLAEFLAARPLLRHAVIWLLPSIDIVQVFSLRKHFGLAVEVSEAGLLTTVLEDRKGTVVTGISEVHEHDGVLWFGSVANSNIAVLAYNA